MKLLVTGGEQRRPRSLRTGSAQWYKYKRGHILLVDPVTESVRVEHSYESPPDVVADEEPAVLFKQGTLYDGMLYLATQTEILIYSYPEFAVKHYLTLPRFHDVHHVRPTNRETLLVANTGLDQVLEIDYEGGVIREWNTVGKEPWGRFDPAIDYRKVSSTKPYESHPNYVFEIDAEVWATRFMQKDAISLDHPGRRIDIDVERVHDGVRFGDHIYFTAVDGHVVIVNRETLAVEERINLAALEGTSNQLGWCRGILPDETGVWVGFTRLRPTAFRENVAWVKDGFRKSMPTHIARYDLEKRRLVQRINLEDHDLNAVFSIFAT